MYYYGLFVTHRDLHPIDRTTLKEGAVRFKAISQHWGYECEVYVLGGEYPADAAKEFGGPVNLVVACEERLYWENITEPAYHVFSGLGVELFVIPYLKEAIMDLAWAADAMNTADEPDWMTSAKSATTLQREDDALVARMRRKWEEDAEMKYRETAAAN